MNKKVLIVLAVVFVICICITALATIAIIIYVNNKDDEEVKGGDDIKPTTTVSQTPVITPTKTTDTKIETYRNDYYTVDYPSNFLLEEESDSDNEISIYYYQLGQVPRNSADESISIWLDMEDETLIDTDSCQYDAEDTYSYWTEQYPDDNIQLKSYKVEKLASYDTCHIVFTSTVNDKDVTEHIYYLTDGTDLFAINIYINRDEEHMDEFLEIAKSIKFVR